jgi:hypothetical protein
VSAFFSIVPKVETLRISLISVCIGFLVSLAPGCDDQVQTGGFVEFNPPQELKAYSANDSTVNLTWSPSPDAGESSFLGYIVEFNGGEDSLGASQLAYGAAPLLAGIRVFTLYSYRSDGPRSNGATIRWAPAARFDTPVTITEFFIQNPTRASGFNVGSQSTDPSAMSLDVIDSAVINLMDLYLFGGSGQITTPLALWSAHLFRGDLKQTMFSSVTHSSTTLDFPLAAFPDDVTFVKDTIAALDNTIYYAKIQGDVTDTLFARIHVRIVPGLSFPNRAVEIRVSLQRVPGVPYAALAPENSIWRRPQSTTLRMSHCCS